ncbi:MULTISPECIES: DUF29 domain-containing protein [unclassified Synechocystis]|uniref:DUF29 domain-containing protein n=1 Tax=unclassified Synechocystis TaxID=2640012 RepID=UPI000417FBEF|nr:MULTISPECIES: DUF29 domain-containing protein [unclassified Synechocystis]AIE74690.1 hypothetical protein D082_21620 [Synechocystis sp. PCC 6714]MCT0253954.1 DUF29 domain-containing protein [Synechocystis sp. CS-94]
MSSLNLTDLYEHDFYQWLTETSKCLNEGNFEAVDTAHLIEELNDLGNSSKVALESNLAVLIAYLLKLTVQSDAPDTTKNSWYNSIDEHRQRVQKQLKKNPSLKSYWDTALAEAYGDARKLAIKESQRAKFGVPVHGASDYPQQCPFSQAQILDDDFYGLF